MTKADWLDFFEAINGRSATEEEIAAALAAGEFQDEAPAVESSASSLSTRLCRSYSSCYCLLTLLWKGIVHPCG